MEMVNNYGYVILFLSLMLELIALPIPTEILMSYVGYLVYQEEMNGFMSILVGALGSISGMTIAYFIGLKLGFPFFNKYGRFVHLSPERLNKTSETFNRYWKRLLLFACFIPGVRHLTGYSAGLTKVPYRSFAFYSYIGAVIWVGTFVTLGKVLGPQYKLIETSAWKYLIIFILTIVAMAILYRVAKGFRHKIKLFLLTTVKSLYSKCYALMMLIVQIIFNRDWHSLIQNSFAISKLSLKGMSTFVTIIGILIKAKVK